MKMVAGVSRLEMEPVIGHNQWELKKKNLQDKLWKIPRGETNAKRKKIIQVDNVEWPGIKTP